MIVKEIEVNSIITPSKLPDADFVINPYTGCLHACRYCYAEFMKRFAGTDEDWGKFVYVKSKWKSPLNIKKLANRKVLLSSVTDPYQQVEHRYKLTRKILEQFAGSDCKLEILTKSDLVLRDLDVIKKIPEITVGMSINATHDLLRKVMEPKAKPVQKRMDALKTLKSEGIRTYLFVSPIFPALSNVQALIQAMRPYVDYFLFENLNLRGAYKKRVLELIGRHFPEYGSLYQKIYTTAYGQAYWKNFEQTLRDLEKEGRQEFRIYFHH
ncbi:MAG: radical SAM protein [Thermoactinomyces sp.]